MKPLFKSDYAKLHQRARQINEQFRKRDGVGSYEVALSQAKQEYCKPKK